MALAGAIPQPAQPASQVSLSGKAPVEGAEQEKRIGGEEVAQAEVHLSANAASPTLTSSLEKAKEGLSAEGTKRNNLAPAAMAERSQETATTAASLNTAAAVTGLQPWDRSWVFQGGDKNPELRTLLGPNNDGMQVALENMAEAPSTLLDAFSSETRGTDAGGIAAHEARLPQGMPAARAEQAMESLNPLLSAFGGNSSGAEGAEELDSSAASRSGLPRGRSHAGVELDAKRSLSLVSGSDFLKVRGTMENEPIELRKQRGTGMDSTVDSIASLTGTRAGLQPEFSNAKDLPAVNGQVVQGSMTRERLSTDALQGVSQQILKLNANGGGEFKIRLKPDSLGEVQLRVSTLGNEVGLKIQASDDKAKRILEESLGSLRDALAGQSLNLGRVDVQVQPAFSSASQSGLENAMTGQENAFQSHQHAAQQQEQRQSHAGRQSGWDPNGSLGGGAPRPLATGFQTASARTAGSGRLDVHA